MGDRAVRAGPVDRPDVVAEVGACFDRYDTALLAGDVDALGGWFWAAPEAIRFGIGEELYGAEAIAAYRRSAPPVVRAPFRRRTVTTFGTDVATVCAEFDDDEVVGRQTQTWVRTADGWRIASAHVSLRPITAR